MRILGIESASLVASVAIVTDDDDHGGIYGESEKRIRRHFFR